MAELSTNPADLPSLTLEQYVNLLSGVPLPTQEQKENFIEYVAHAHSWYKHLPLYPPGVPFYFFIDKYAACDRLVSRDGTAILKERVEPGFHYSEYRTAEYRELFGHLAYSCGYGKKVILLSKGPVAIPRDDLVAVPNDDGQMYRLPSDVVDAGMTRLTAVIHTYSALFAYWHDLRPEDHQQIHWPEDSGGQITFEKIVSRSQEMRGRRSKTEPLFIKLPAAKTAEAADPILCSGRCRRAP